ncbi:metal-dependent transcriptional regulator [Corynebacterium suicordis]|uniref:Diphtheria toxin repressor n=1 Tax=Corynebacterium suicordis DSM 45110 TaxID=1121369 RepID=A0ABR9ZKJ0_9CORY|nr:metal-dependent transcriptional regulator [Corynebacterium suicordis]MBF4553137.1 metal-dependent transcriptional regulator [Corynebacterium suicordis DSM 45110]MDR6277900.1 DtxR family Mn-dependent transcriptional regulator [Corynebacterium suicordis]
MHVTDLPDKSQDYLKAIFDLQEWGEAAISLGRIAARLGQRNSTTSEAIKRLAAKGLVDHSPYAAIRLTEPGRELALQMVRRHRLIETYLFQDLGYQLDELHEEAEILEHAVSDKFIERIAARLGHPTRDPHGDPIPDASGEFHVPQVFSLVDATPGQNFTIDRISDRDPELLRYLQSKGAMPEATVEVLERPYPDLAELRILHSSGEGTLVQLPLTSLDSVLCREASNEQ